MNSRFRNKSILMNNTTQKTSGLVLCVVSLLYIFTMSLLVTGCSLKKTTTEHLVNIEDNTSEGQDNSANNNSPDISSPIDTKEGTSSSDSSSTSNGDSDAVTDPSDSSTALEDTLVVHPEEPITISETTQDNYHDLITDLSGISLSIDVTDSRLNGLKTYLSDSDFNFTLKEIGQIQHPDSLYVLCNKLNQLPQEYVPSDLRDVNVNFTFSEASEKKMLRDDAATALEALFAAAKEAGYDLFALSGYRSYTTQINNYTSRVSSLGQEGADKISARPGHSEHQSGLAMDITSESASFKLIEEFGETPEGLWVKENAHRFGFIIRYQQTTTAITGYNYEPWHLRYITPDLATYLYENNVTVEELYALLLGK